MSLAEQIYQTVKPLPQAMAQEVLDFALFLRQREENSEWQNLMLAQTSSLTDWNNDEDEVGTMFQSREMVSPMFPSNYSGEPK